MLKCEECGKEYMRVKKTSKYCSSKCVSKAWYRRTKNEKKEVEGIGKTADCVVCGKLYIKTRKDKLTCGKSCSTRYATLKWKTKETLNANEIFDSFNDKVEEFLYECKRKCYYFDAVDIFKLVDLHDKIHPSKWLPDSNSDREDYYQEMLIDLINFVKKNRELKNEV